MLDKEYFINRETGQEFLSIQDYINSLKIDFDNDLKKGKLSPDGKNIDLDDPMIPDNDAVLFEPSSPYGD